MKFRHQALQLLPAVMLVCSLLPLPVQAQFAQQGPKLVGTAAYLEGQGHSVSLSGDGNTAIVGAPFGISAPDRFIEGSALLFTRSGGLWSQQQELVFAVTPFDEFGFSVSISADGNTAIVGLPFSAENTPGGAAVYVRSGGVWIQQGGLFNGGLYTNTGLHEGFSVSLSGDGNTAIIGAPGVAKFDPINHSPDTGAALVFTRSTDGVWKQQAELVGTDTNGMFADTRLGSSVSLSGDGNTAIVGNGGAAWVFTRSSDGGWTQQAILAGGGSSVALSNDGNTAMVGNASGAGVYARSTTASSGIGWNQEATLAGTGSLYSPFPYCCAGFSVSLSADGNAAMVGSSVFTRSEVGWTQQELPAGTGAVGDAAQGFSVALSADGNTAMVGGPDDNNGAGAAWVYSEFVFPGTPGKANCYGQRVLALARQFGGLNSAAAALGFASVPALQDAIMEFCWE